MVNDAHKNLIKVMTIADLSAVVEIEAKVFRGVEKNFTIP